MEEHARQESRRSKELWWGLLAGSARAHGTGRSQISIRQRLFIGWRPGLLAGSRVRHRSSAQLRKGNQPPQRGAQVQSEKGSVELRQSSAAFLRLRERRRLA